MWTRLQHFNRHIVVLLFAASLPLAPAIAAPGTPGFSFETTPEIRLAAGQENGRAVFVLRLAGEIADHDGTIQMSDKPALDRPATAIVFEPGPSNRQSGMQTWFIAADITSLPTNSTLQRFLTLSYGGFTQTLPYTLTNKPLAAFFWKVWPTADKRPLNTNEPLRFSLSVGPVPATNVRLLWTSFIDIDQSRPFAGSFHMCLAGQDPCSGSPITLNANASYDLLIQSTGPAAAWPGKFDGSFTVVSAEKPDGDSIAITFYVTAWWWQWLGVLVIAIGIAGAFLLNFWIAERNARNAKLRPAALLADQVDELARSVRQLASDTSVPFPNAEQVLGDIKASLSLQNLTAHRFVGGRIPAFSASGDEAGGQAYTSFLEQLGLRITATAIVLQACRQAIADSGGISNPHEREALKDALVALDKLLPSGQAPDKDVLSQRVLPILQQLSSTLAQLRQVQNDDALTATFNVGYSTQQIAIETDSLNRISWLVFGALSLAIGSYLLVASNPGFGQWKDFLLCLLWGFGLPSAGEKLSSLSSAGVAQNFGLKLTKVV